MKRGDILSVSTMIGVVFMLIFIGVILLIGGTVKTKRYLKLTGIAIIIALPFTVTNFGNSIYANSINIISTILFLVSWLVFGVIQGYTKKTSFTKFILGYWLANVIFLWMGYVLELSYGLFALFNLIPMYGIYYYIQHFSSGVSYLLLTLPLVISWIGFIMGEKFFRTKVFDSF